MRFRAPLDDILRGRTALAVLRTLVQFPGKEFTGRELAGLAGVAPSKAIVELDRLLKNGIVERRTAGRTHLWRAVEAHFVFEVLRKPLMAERAVMADLRRTLAKELGSPGVRSAVLFGSIARGEEEPESDIDVLLVVGREDDKDRVAENIERATRAVRGRYGNALHVIVYTEAELARKRDAGFLKAAHEGIPLIGGGAP